MRYAYTYTLEDKPKMVNRKLYFNQFYSFTILCLYLNKQTDQLTLTHTLLSVPVPKGKACLSFTVLTQRGTWKGHGEGVAVAV